MSARGKGPAASQPPAEGLQARLAEVIYGIGSVTEAEILGLLARLGPPPWRVVALQYAPAAQPPASWRARSGRWEWLFLHPGLGYLVYRGASPLPQLDLPSGVVVGESQPAAAALDLILAVQNTVLSLRRRDLAEIARRHGPPPSALRERETRAVALARLRSGESPEPALDCWIDTVLLRHQGIIHTVQRKVVEFLAMLTGECDLDREVSRSFRIAAMRVLGTWGLSAMMGRFRSDVLAIAAQLRHEPGVSPPPPSVQAAMAFARREQTRSITLRHAAHAAGVSAAHLARSFRLHLGCTFTDFLTGLRLAHAKELLATTDLPVTAIANRCGFKANEHFHRVFRRRVGSTPGAFRSHGGGCGETPQPVPGRPG